MNLLVFFSVLAVSYGQIPDSVRVTYSQGTVEGYRSTDGNYYTFHGLPYGLPRTGSNRFRASAPAGPLPGLYLAYDNGIFCVRPGPDRAIGVENCLLLNIFANNFSASNPVLVWLNGEEFTPETIAKFSFKKYIEEEDFVVVTLNYRLSIFGNVCLKYEEAPGNVGLKDIILGLQWIQRNIAAFGGNPNNVVLMGHGSAAVMVDLITLSPKANNLVHKAIVLSGSALRPGAVSFDPFGAVTTLITNMGMNTQYIEHFTVALGYAHINYLSAALNKVVYTNNTEMFAPCIEDTDNEDAVLTDLPINILKAGTYNHIPYMAGYVTGEGTKRVNHAFTESWFEKMQSNFTDFIPGDLDFGSNKTTYAQEIRDFYFGSNNIDMNTIDSYFGFHGDSIVVGPVLRAVRERAVTSSSQVRLFEFGYLGINNSFADHEQITLTAVKHGGILNYLFNFELSEAEKTNVSDLIVGRISDFVRTGNPLGWPVVSNQSFSYMSYEGSTASNTYSEVVRSNPQNETTSFWDPLYATYYRTPSLSSAAKLTSLLTIVFCSILITKILE